MKWLKCSMFSVVLCLWPALASAGSAPEAAEAPDTQQPGPAVDAPATAQPPSGKPATLGDVLQALGNGPHEPFTDVPFDALVEFHKAEGGQSYATISIAFRPDKIHEAAGDTAAALPFARISSLGEEKVNYDFTEERDFAESGVDTPSGSRVYQTGYALSPGKYELIMGVWVPQHALAGAHGQLIDIPDFNSSKLELSSITLASTLEKATHVEAGIKQPFIWGSFKVVPRVEKSFSRQEPLRLYYQIYNAAPDPQSGKPRLKITYTFFQKKNGEFRQAAPPHVLGEQASQVALYELPLSGWPAGEFKVRIDVLDAVTQGSATGEVLFDLR